MPSWVSLRNAPLSRFARSTTGPRATTLRVLSNDADLNDYKQDGKVNLLKYAFGLNPTLSNVGQIPQPQRIGGNFVASFTQPAGVSGITYGAEWSTTLLDGSWTAIPDTGIPPQHIFSIPIGTHPPDVLAL